jgi:predicted PurR-regulated permease PerM
MTAGTAISLFVIPLAYYYAFKCRERIAKYFIRLK